MKRLQEKIMIAELRQMAEGMFGNLVKAVVDVRLRQYISRAKGIFPILKEIG
jgi:hypothetical protein